MEFKCKSFKDFSDRAHSILLFGLVRPVYRPKGTLNTAGMYRYCTARDDDGTVYDIYTDYDPCIKASYTIAVVTKEVSK